MNFLLDTHVLLWWLFDDPRVSGAVRQAIEDPEATVFVSSASAWEISTKSRIGKLPEGGDVPERLASYVERAGFRPLAITIEHALAAGALPGPHRDPFDRMLIAQARTEKLAVATADPVFRDYGARVVW